MSKLSIIVGSIIVFAAIMGMWFAGNYNSLVTAKNQVDNSWASVETQYQRRFDLIDNLVVLKHTVLLVIIPLIVARLIEDFIEDKDKFTDEEQEQIKNDLAVIKDRLR